MPSELPVIARYGGECRIVAAIAKCGERDIARELYKGVIAVERHCNR